MAYSSDDDKAKGMGVAAVADGTAARDAASDDVAADGKQVRMLLEQLAAVLAEMDVMKDEDEEASAVPMDEARTAKLEELATRAEQLETQIERLRKIAARERQITARLSRSAPLPKQAASNPQTPAPNPEDRSMVASAPQSNVYAVPRRGYIRGFGSDPNAEQRAYAVGMWALGALYQNEPAKRWCAERGIEARDQSIGTATAGGNLVPTILSDSVIQLITEYGVVRPNVKIQPMPGPYLEIPRRTGGLQAFPMSEAQSTTVSTKTWDKVVLTARKWGCEVRLSNEVLADAVIDLASDITEEMARAFAFAEDNSTFNGDGSSSFQSITGIVSKLNATVTTGTGQSAVTTGQKGLYVSPSATSFETLSIADFTYLLATLPLYARGPGAKWYISPAGWAASMQRLALTSGSGTGLAGGNTQNQVEAALGLRFLGYPVVLTNALDGTLGSDPSKVKVVFGDLNLGVVLGDLRQITYRRSTERLFELDQTVMLGTARFDIAVHGTGSTTAAGPIVGLKTKAA